MTNINYNDQTLKPILRAFFSTATKLWKYVLEENTQPEESKVLIIYDKLTKLFESHKILKPYGKII